MAMNLPIIPPTYKSGINATMVVITAAMIGIPTSLTPSTAAFNGGFPCLR